MKMKSALGAFLLGTSTLVCFNAAFAADFDVEIDGSGTPKSYTASGDLTIAGAFYFGNTQADTTFTNNGHAMSSTAVSIVGYSAASDNNEVTLTGDGADWDANGHLFIGYEGSDNTMSILNGATVDMKSNSPPSDLSLGKLVGSNDNALIVSGANTELKMDGTIYVGQSGTGNTFDIEDGAKVTSLQARIGGGTDSNGVATGNAAVVDGDGSSWTMYGTLRVGGGVSSDSSSNSLTISDGGEVTTDKAVHVGYEATSDNNSILITGAGSKLNVAVLNNPANRDLNIGRLLGGSTGNSVTVTDSGELDVNGAIFIDANNTLDLSDKAKVTSDALTMIAGSNFDLEVDDENEIDFDVTGAAALSGTLTTTYTGSLNKSYNVLTAGSISGTFEDLDAATLERGFSASVSYTATQANLDLVAHLGEGDVLGQNQRNVAKGLNAAFNNGTTLGADFVSIYGLSGEPLRSALTQITGESNAYGMTSGVWNSDDQLMSALRANSLSGVNGGWASFLGASSNAQDDDEAGTNTSDLQYSGLAGGVSFKASDAVTAGIAIASGKSDWTADEIGSGSLDASQVGGFAKVDLGQGYILASGVMGKHSLAASRGIAGFDESFGLDADITSSSVELEAGYSMALTEDVALAPYASVSMSQSELNDAISETGTDVTDFALEYSAQTMTKRSKSVGVHLSAKAGANATFYSDLSLADGTADGVTGAFTQVSGSEFSVNGAGATDPQVKAAIGGALQLGQNSVASFNLGGTFLSDSEDVNGSVGFRYNW